MPLDFICLAQSHTGEYLAETVMSFFNQAADPGPSSQICGIVSDNARNNKGCMLRRFGTQKQASAANNRSTALDYSEDSDSDDDAAGQIRLLFRAVKKKLKYSPNSKAKFVDICVKQGCLTPHTVKTRSWSGSVTSSTGLSGSTTWTTLTSTWHRT
ncbi:hypothetical protein Pst134EB_030942 [Puccinia striiformis f. sp. tritici]|nr:hypothetical protein Pst134EB_030942 [Puccinia striiformis f. sp. tritici]